MPPKQHLTLRSGFIEASAPSPQVNLQASR